LQVKLRDAIRPILSISRLGNQLMQASQPWVLVKSAEASRRARGATVVGLCANIIALLAVLLQPFMPATSRNLRQQLGSCPVFADFFGIIPVWDHLSNQVKIMIFV